MGVERVQWGQRVNHLAMRGKLSVTQLEHPNDLGQCQISLCSRQTDSRTTQESNEVCLSSGSGFTSSPQSSSSCRCPKETRPAHSFIFYETILLNLEGWGCSSVGTASDRHAVDAGTIPRCGTEFFSQSQLSVQTLLRCTYTPVHNGMYLHLCAWSMSEFGGLWKR